LTDYGQAASVESGAIDIGEEEVGMQLAGTIAVVVSVLVFAQMWNYATSALASSSHIRGIIRDRPGWWDTLEPLLDAYNTTHPGQGAETAAST
jgi:hypothetical protein